MNIRTSTIRHSLFMASAVLLAIVWSSLVASGQIAVRNQGFVPFSDEPIYYRTAPVNDPVAVLNDRLSKGETTLTYEPGHGYLRSLLERLEIPLSSQMLVFSKTSFQYRLISPSTPRALYFNDDVYVGFVQGGKALELVSFDANQGAIFYLLDQNRVERPSLQRAELDCTQCHIAANTKGVPGVLVRSVFAKPTGTQAVGSRAFLTGHQSPFAERFGGWYVTGTHGRQRHMGNAVVEDPKESEGLDRDNGANIVDLATRVDVSKLVTPHSDIVAQLVHAHQTQMHNLITLTNYQTRLALHAAAKTVAARQPADALSDETRATYEQPAEELVRYLLFADEAPLEGPIAGTSGFAAEFSARGPRDEQGRSLRDFDLQTRLFKHPCSYLIYSSAFDALPEPARSFVHRRLFEVLSGRDQTPAFARLTPADRKAVFEILLATKPDLAKSWKHYEESDARAARPRREPKS